jgi:hypothetical protein
MSQGRRSGDVGESLSLQASSPRQAETLDAAVAGLAALDAHELRLQWRNHLGGAAPTHLPRWLLVRVLAYRRQAAALGDLDKASLRVIRASQGGAIDSPLVLSTTASQRRGTELASSRERCSCASGEANWKG